MIPEYWVVPHEPRDDVGSSDPVARSTFILVAIALTVAIAAAGWVYVILALPSSVS